MTATDAGVALPLDDPAALTSQVTDSADVLDDTAAQSAVEELSQQTGVDLYVVYVDDFGGLESEEWVIETGSLTGLGETDAMLAVAVGDREFWFEPPASLTTAEGQAIREAVVDELGQDDWDGAVTAAATTTAQVVASEGGTGGAPAPAPAGGSSGLGGLLVLGVVAALGIALLVAVVRRSSRRRADAQGAAAAAPAPTG
ncbi:TPM domain-containing protein [Aquipuribacter hungaricus]